MGNIIARHQNRPHFKIPAEILYTGERIGPLQAWERSISKWKTDISADGRSVTIKDGSDGNEAYLHQTFSIIRYERGGGKVIFRV